MSETVIPYKYDINIMVLKTQIVLYMYDKLLSGKGFTVAEIISNFNISERTFRRYVSEINCFLANNYKEQQVGYSNDKKVYILC